MAKHAALTIAEKDGTNPILYHEDQIVSMNSHRQLFDGQPSVGNCFVGELNCGLTVPSVDIPINAKLTPWIIDESNVWHQKSVFYIYRRRFDVYTRCVTIQAYDPLYYGEESYCQAGEQGTWPRWDVTVMQEIASRIHTSIPSADITLMTTIARASGVPNGRYMVPYPGITLTEESEDGTPLPDTLSPDTSKGALTMREVAGRIAGYYGGNWMIDNKGYLRLILLGAEPTETNYLVTPEGDPITLGGVRILV